MKRSSFALKMKPLFIDAHRRVKDQIIYVRMNDNDVKQIDVMKKKYHMKSRSEMIRTLVVEALKSVQ